jgi:hypothetical protein
MRGDPAPRLDRTVSRRRILVGAAAVALAGTATAGCDDTKIVPDADESLAPTRGARPVTGPALQRRLGLSWLPAGYRVTGYGIDTNHEWVTGEATSNSHFTVRAEVYRAGVTPPPDGADWDSWVVATGVDRVDGLPTRWAGQGGMGRRSSTVCLSWQQPSGGGAARVTFTGGGPDNVATACRIGAGMGLAGSEPVLLPVAPRDLPASLRLRGVDAYDPSAEDRYLYRMRYAPRPLPVDSTVEHGVLEVQASPMTFAEQILMSDPGLGPNATIEGHQARRTTTKESGDAFRDRLTLWEVDGLKLVIDVRGASVGDLIGADPAGTVFRGLTVYEQRADWVPAPPLSG